VTTCAIIVTYNRVQLLERCLDAMLAQTKCLDRVVIIDNASTDTTQQRISQRAAAEPLLEYRRLDTNTGGAGGFSEGIRVACEGGYDWAWIMDDDAVPHLDAYEKLIEKAVDSSQLYGSVAVCGDETSWGLSLVETVPQRDVFLKMDVPELAAVRFLPFLGLLVPCAIVARIGLPDAGYFIAADDVEYCMRAQRDGARIFVAGESRIEHPKADTYFAHLGFFRLTCLRIAPWKRYYDTRNRLLIAREYFGASLFTKTLPGTFARWIACMLNEPNRLRQTWAFIAGTCDGLLGRKGPRHTVWRIKA
jgi:Predicted glycosyltransferases